MQLESELRNITLGDSTIHNYGEKIKKIADFLEGLVKSSRIAMWYSMI